MDLVPLLIVLLSAAGHVMWNFQAKQSRNKLVFIWGLYAIALPLFLPLYLWRGLGSELGGGAWACIVASGATKAVYIIFIAEALHVGDLSITYPLSRIAPAIVPFWAIAFLGERLSVLGGLGIFVVCLSIVVIHLEGLSAAHVLQLHTVLWTRATAFALLAALAVSAYSIIDKLAIVRYADPVPFNYIHWIVCSALLAPYVVWRCGLAEMRAIFRAEWLPMTLSALLDFGAYTLVLYVMETSKVSYIVAARQTSQIFAVLLGTLVLRERCGGIRLFAGSLILIGVTLIGVAK